MTDRYGIILADPPWRHSSTAGGGSRRAASNQYPTMSTAEICRMDWWLQDHCTPIARLFLWVPDSMIDDGREVMRAWGFPFNKIALVWVKLGAKEHAGHAQKGMVFTETYGWRKLAFGAGRTTRNGAEICLLGSRGRMPVHSSRERQVIIAPTREHSRKPEEAYERIEAMYPDRRYLELFARAQRPGWAVWGNETELFQNES